VAPRSELEEEIAGIWREVLGVEQVGIDDNFFDLGGNSLLAMRTRSLIESRLEHQLSMVDIFGFPTVRALVSRCKPVAGDKQGIEASSASLSHVRERARKSRTAMQRRRRGQ
jgi:acyl carrier protein